MNLYLRDDFKALWRDKNAFEQVEGIEGDVYRELEGRRTLRFEMQGKGYFLKLHRGVGWKEIFKNLMQLRLPILGARNEKAAVDLLNRLGVGTMSVVAFGERGGNPARQYSFIVTEAIEPSISLEDLAIQWRTAPPAPSYKRALIHQVCAMIKTMHDNGINHRDLYICHFLLRDDYIDLAVIDLHRALIHKSLPYRWRVKDLASLYYSAFDVPLTLRDKLRFIRAYSNEPLKVVLKRDQKLWQDVEKKAHALYAKALKKGIVR